LHDNKIIHRDLKLENILVSIGSNGGITIRLADFGYSTFINPGQKIKSGLGSKSYIAPEMLNNNAYDFKIDIWSATIIAYCLMLYKMPYKGSNLD